MFKVSLLRIRFGGQAGSPPSHSLTLTPKLTLRRMAGRRVPGYMGLEKDETRINAKRKKYHG